MYSGITKGLGEVVALERQPDLLSYSVRLPDGSSEGLQLGASVSIDGVCQTVVGIDGEVVSFDAIAETLARTTLGSLSLGALVSVERSCRIGDEIGGHELAGHVLGTGRVAEVLSEAHRRRMTVGIPRSWAKYVMAKGFIAVNGSSLTVGEDLRLTGEELQFELHLIPETLRVTRLGQLSVGDQVNIELDARTVAVVDTVERVLAEREQRLPSDPASRQES